jgi:hypothetical protein
MSWSPVQLSVELTDELSKSLNLASIAIMEAQRLGNTDVIESVEWIYKDNAFVLWANEYLQWIISGRKPMARKIPVEALIKWMKKKNIVPIGAGQSTNSVAYAIQNSIYKSGIKMRPFGTLIVNASLDILSEKIAEDISVQTCEAIAYELTITLGKN